MLFVVLWISGGGCNWELKQGYVADANALVLYFYLPIGVLVLLNIVMFVTTAFRLQVHTRETKQVLKGSDSRKSDEADRQRYEVLVVEIYKREIKQVLKESDSPKKWQGR